MSVMIGLQLYAYDVIDEGAENVVDLASRAGVDVLFLLASYSDADVQLVPGRGGDLKHNPHRQTHLPHAVLPPSDEYPPELSTKAIVGNAADGARAIDELREAAARRMVVVPWVTLLTQQAAWEHPDACVINARGDPVPGWLCPNRPATRTFLSALIRDLLRRSAARSIFLDRIRFPESGPSGLIDFCTCFCEHCRTLARGEGLDLDAIRARLQHLVSELDDAPGAAAARAVETFSSGLHCLVAVSEERPLLDWLRFRQSIVTRLVAFAAEEARSLGADAWLDVWPPSYGWLLGQDLSQLRDYAAWVKPFTYHRWGGGADIAGLISRAATSAADRQILYEAFQALFRFPGPVKFGDFRENGLSPAFITTETRFAARFLAKKSKLAAGLQLWNMGPRGVAEALDYAARAEPDGFFFHCYGWATVDELEAVGTWLLQSGRKS
jgi:hypothetical protein